MVGLSVVLALLLGATTVAAQTRVQAKINANTGGGNALGATFDTATPAGRLVVAWCSVWMQSIVSAANPVISDSGGHSWTLVLNRVSRTDPAGSYNARLYLAWALTTGAGTLTVTCNPPGTSAYITVGLVEYAGIVLTNPRDQAVSNGSDGSTAMSSGTTAATTSASQLLTAGGQWGTTMVVTETAPLTRVLVEDDVVNTSPLVVSERFLTTVGTYTASWTLGASGAWAAGAATFHATVTPSRRRVHGQGSLLGGIGGM